MQWMQSNICILGVGGINTHCPIDSVCKAVMIFPVFTSGRNQIFMLEKPIRIQLAVMGSKSVINYGTNTTIDIDSNKSKEYFDVVNIDYYDAILGTPFPKKYEAIIDLIQYCLKIKEKITWNQAGDYQVLGSKPRIDTSVKALKTKKHLASTRDSHWLSPNPSFNNDG